MPRNFDSTLDDDLSFIAGGKTYTMHLVSYKVLAHHDDVNDAAQSDEGESNEAAGKRLVDRLVDYLIPADQKPFLKAVEDGQVPFAQLQEILIWANGVQTGRPTSPPAPSGSGPGGTDRSSSAESGSPRRAAPRTRTPARR